MSGDLSPIPGGFILQPRCMDESKFWKDASLLMKVLWGWLCRHAQHRPYHGLERGQLVATLDDLADACSDRVGYRRRRPNKYRVWRALEGLREERMTATTKTTRGLIITIVNYDFYQNPANYERNGECNDRATVAQQTRNTINKNDKNEKNDKEGATLLEAIPAALDTPDFRSAWDNWKAYKAERKPKLTERAAAMQLKRLATWGEVRAIAAVNHSIAQNWQGIYEENSNGQSSKRTSAGVGTVAPAQSGGFKQPLRINAND